MNRQSFFHKLNIFNLYAVAMILFSGLAFAGNTESGRWMISDRNCVYEDVRTDGVLNANAVISESLLNTNKSVLVAGKCCYVSASITGVSSTEICDNGEGVNITVELTGTPPWTLSYIAGGKIYIESGIGTSPYNFQLTGTDFGGPGSYVIQLKSVSDLYETGPVNSTQYSVTVKKTYKPDIQGPLTVGSGKTENYLTESNSGSSYEWMWTEAPGGDIATPYEASTDITFGTPTSYPAVYQLKVIETTYNGCMASDLDSITVLKSPEPKITPVDTIQCQDDVVVYTTPYVSGNTYAWTVTGGTPASGTGNSITVTWTDVGMGSVSVIEDNSGITGSDEVDVLVDSHPNTGLSVSAPSEVCINDTAEVLISSSESGFYYQLCNAEDGSPIGDAVAGDGGDIVLSTSAMDASLTFSILVYNNGCSDELSQQVTIEVNNPDAPTGDASQIFCEADQPSVAGLIVDGENIQWYSLQTGGEPIAETELLTDSTTYYATQTVNGCESTDRLGVALLVGETPETSNISGNTEPDCEATGVTYSVALTSGSSYDWSVPTEASIVSGATGIENNEIIVDFGTQDGYVEVVETSSLGCSGSPVQLYIDVLDCGLEADFTVDETDACQNEEIVFSDNSQWVPEGSTYEWNFGADAIPATASSSGPHTVYYTSAGYKTIQLTVGQTDSDIEIKSDYVLIHSNPVVNLGDDITICDGNSVELDAGNYSAYLWSTGEMSQSITVYEDAGVVSVTVTDENGCQGSDEIIIQPCDPAEVLGTIPNAFTPNGDGYHDSWVINNIYLFPDVSIQVYDRWGRIVFQVDGGYDNDWYGEGPNGNDLPVDTYYYVIDLKVSGSEPITGTVSIIR